MNLTLFLAIWLVVSVPTTLEVASLLAGAVSALSPFVLRYVKLTGKQMAGVSFLVAAVLAVVAAAITGQLSTIDTSSIATLLGTAGFLWTVQQAVYHALANVPPDHPLTVQTPAAPPQVAGPPR